MKSTTSRELEECGNVGEWSLVIYYCEFDIVFLCIVLMGSKPDEREITACFKG